MSLRSSGPRAVLHAARRRFFGEPHEGAAHGGAADAAVGLQEPHRAGGVQRFERIGGSVAAQLRRAEQRRQRHIENPGDAGQPPGADTVRSSLVFLHLLEGDANELSEFGLRHAARVALRADAQRHGAVVSIRLAHYRHTARAPRESARAIPAYGTASCDEIKFIAKSVISLRKRRNSYTVSGLCGARRFLMVAAEVR